MHGLDGDELGRAHGDVCPLEQRCDVLEVRRAAERALTAADEQVAHREPALALHRHRALARRVAVEPACEHGLARHAHHQEHHGQHEQADDHRQGEAGRAALADRGDGAAGSHDLGRGSGQVDGLRRGLVALEADLQRHDAVGVRGVLQAIRVADLGGDLAVHRADARSRLVGREHMAARLAGERVQRSVVPAADRDGVDRDACVLGRRDGLGELGLGRVVAVGQHDEHLRQRRGGGELAAGLDHGVVERRPGLRVQRHLVHRRRERVRVGVERVDGVGLVPERVDPDRVGLALGLHEGGRSRLGGDDRLADHRAADVDREADGRGRAAARLGRR